MKQKLLIGIMGFVFCGNVMFSQNRQIVVNKTSTPITIDGEIDAAWKNVKQIDLDKYGKGKTVPDKSNFQASFKLLWDDDFLYFLGTIYDDVIMDQAACVGASPAAPADWEVDNFELYWSPANSKLADATELIQVRLAYANVGSENPTATTKNGYSPGGFTLPDFVNAARVDISGGYIVEASIDLKVSAEAIGKDAFVANDTVGFNVMGCDNDGTDKRSNIACSIDSSQWDQADTLLRLVLSADIASVINKLNSKTNVYLYPNPVATVLKISGKEKIAIFEISNLEGQIVMKAVKPSNSVNVAALPAGLYNVRTITESGNIVTKKIVKR